MVQLTINQTTKIILGVFIVVVVVGALSMFFTGNVKSFFDEVFPSQEDAKLNQVQEEQEIGLPTPPPSGSSCADGTPHDECSETQPFWCYNGVLILNCHVCGCPEDQECQRSGACEVLEESGESQETQTQRRCSDGTPEGECTDRQPWFCVRGTNTGFGGLVSRRCQVCGCPREGQVCDPRGHCYTVVSREVRRVTTDTRQESEETLHCNDGTPEGECSANLQYECRRISVQNIGWTAQLFANCERCGCPPGTECRHDACVGIPTSCSDGTPLNSCSDSLPLFCNEDGQLIQNCHDCGCPEDQECQDSGQCSRAGCIGIIQSGDPEDKLDVVIIAAEYDESELNDFASQTNDFIRHLINIEPFDSQRNKINFYRVDNLRDLNCYVRATNDPDSRRCIRCRSSAVRRVARQCPNDKILVLINRNVHQGCALSSYATSTLGEGRLFGGTDYPLILTHEFGHLFGELWDEYVYQDRRWPPRLDGGNCDRSSNCESWADLQGSRGIRCYSGCTTNSYNRPKDWNSIMKDLRGDFNAVGERILIEKLGEYS